MTHVPVVRQSHLFGAPLREPPKDAETVSHRLLTQGGFIHQLAAGIFSLLPLGFRVHQRIEQIIREEMIG
ncbi:MAG: proline--tRNA ligase, partial [bacterium]|nr:proline--tRNA ligase [bacterium]